MKKRCWMSFDFGITGKYDELYVWLDKIGAVECGDTMCSFHIQVAKNDADPGKAVLGELKKHNAKLRSTDRVYLIWKEGDKLVGRFIHGTRRRAPWTGCYVKENEEIDDVAE